MTILSFRLVRRIVASSVLTSLAFLAAAPAFAQALPPVVETATTATSRQPA